jgi:hypothetical protein
MLVITARFPQTRGANFFLPKAWQIEPEGQAQAWPFPGKVRPGPPLRNDENDDDDDFNPLTILSLLFRKKIFFNTKYNMYRALKILHL